MSRSGSQSHDAGGRGAGLGGGRGIAHLPLASDGRFPQSQLMLVHVTEDSMDIGVRSGNLRYFELCVSFFEDHIPFLSHFGRPCLYLVDMVDLAHRAWLVVCSWDMAKSPIAHPAICCMCYHDRTVCRGFFADQDNCAAFGIFPFFLGYVISECSKMHCCSD